MNRLRFQQNQCIMSAKGRVRCPNTQLPSLLEQMCIWTPDERSDRESKAFEALPVTSQVSEYTPDERSDRESKAFEALPVTCGKHKNNITYKRRKSNEQETSSFNDSGRIWSK